jgi:hypothetical protein
LIENHTFRLETITADLKLIRGRMTDNEKFMQNAVMKIGDLERVVAKNDLNLHGEILDSQGKLQIEIKGLTTHFDIL